MGEKRHKTPRTEREGSPDDRQGESQRYGAGF
jgi:hypothetical protein